MPELDGKTPRAWMLGKTDNISHFPTHDFYDPVKFTPKTTGDNPTYLKENKDQIGRYLGLASNAPEVNAYYFLTQQGRVITRTDVRPFYVERLWYPVVQKHIDTFSREIKRHRKLDDKAEVQQDAPTFPTFDLDVVPRENDEKLGPVPYGPPNPGYFTPEVYYQ